MAIYSTLLRLLRLTRWAVYLVFLGMSRSMLN